MKQNKNEGQKVGSSHMKEENTNMDRNKNKNKDFDHNQQGRTHLSKQDQEIADQARQGKNLGGRNK
jgi:hypothetical protein